MKRPETLAGSLARRGGVDRRAVLGNGDRLAGRAGGFDPGGLSSLDLGQGLCWRRSESRAGFEVGDVSDVAPVLPAPEDVDVVVLHASDPSFRLYRSTLQLRPRASSRVPEGQDFHPSQPRRHSILDVVVDANQVNATYTSKPAAHDRDETARLGCDEGHSHGQIGARSPRFRQGKEQLRRGRYRLGQGVRCRGPVFFPPLGGSFHLTRRGRVKPTGRAGTFSERAGGTARRPR